LRRQLKVFLQLIVRNAVGRAFQANDPATKKARLANSVQVRNFT